MQNLISSSSLTGDAVKNPEGEDLGRIKDIMIDPEDGKIVYYVLSFGGFMGLMGDKLFAIPPQAIQVDREHEQVILNVDKERLENAPGFDKSNWPDMDSAQFGTQVYQHYGYKFPHAA